MCLKKSISGLIVMGLMAAGPVSVFASSGTQGAGITQAEFDNLMRGMKLPNTVSDGPVFMIFIADRKENKFVVVEDAPAQNGKINLKAAVVYDKNGKITEQCATGSLNLAGKEPKFLTEIQPKDLIKADDNLRLGSCN